MYDPDEFFGRKRQTNADRIRKMSDEELAEWHEIYCPGREDIDLACTKESCRDCWLDWLKSPVDGA
jgi:hypothetical protein